MSIDPLLLSRLQFAWVIGFHILLPAITVGLASFIALLEGLCFFTGNEIYFRISSFWTRLFAVAFGMGVVSGVVMPFQFGTNWSRYTDVTANVLSPLFAYEGLTAFFLEAGFLGVLLFGRSLVPKWAHFSAALMVAFGTLLSSFWILSANSWMQTPQGYTIVNGRFFPADWWAIIFNPSFPYRFFHTVVAFYISSGFVVAAAAAYFLRRQKFVPEARVMLSMTMWLLLVLIPVQVFLGDAHGLNTLKYQPAKLAAIEAHWTPEARAPLTLFAIPDQKAATNHAAIEVPLLGSLILTHDVNGVVPGLKQWPAADRPPVVFPFFAFRITVGLGLIMLAIAIAAVFLRRGNRLYETDWFLRVCEWAAPIGLIAVLAGWTTTEVGRQPWTVYGLLRTADAVSPSLTGWNVLLSLLAYMVVYLVMFPSGAFVVSRIIRSGVPQPGAAEAPVEGGRPQAPVVSPPEPAT
ncbi:MAG: cytochrome ubiquinol oxidase subunit I [Rhizomicrobium sp.]